MKKIRFPFLLTCTLILVSGLQHSLAQEKKSSSVHITITEDDLVTTDTTFELKEGQDPDMIKKIVSHLAGDSHMSQELSHNMVWVHSDGDKVWHGKHIMGGIDIDSIREAHKEAKALLIEDRDGEVTVKELDDLEEHVMHFGKDDETMSHKMIFIDTDEEGNHMMKQKEGQKVLIITETGDAEGKKSVKVITGGEDVKAVKKVRVEIEEDNSIKAVEKDKKAEKKKKQEK